MTFQVSWLFLCIGALIVGLVAGFFLARKVMKQQLAKNPPINEKMIRAMFRQMGRTPSEAQVRAIMKSMRDNQN